MPPDEEGLGFGESPKGCPQGGMFCCRQNAAEVASEGEALKAPQTASKSRIIRSNGQNVGKEWTYWTFLE